MRRWLLLFLLVSAAQVAVPLSLILEQETMLARGRIYRFRTAPVDPVDAFQGRYVALRFDVERYETSEEYESGERLYAVLGVDAEGFVRIERLDRESIEGDSVLAVTVRGTGAGQVHLEMPFDRFYMEETEAPRAERMVRRPPEEAESTWAAVRVRDGRGVIEDLFIGDRPIEDAPEEQQEP